METHKCQLVTLLVLVKTKSVVHDGVKINKQDIKLGQIETKHLTCVLEFGYQIGSNRGGKFILIMNQIPCLKSE